MTDAWEKVRQSVDREQQDRRRTWVGGAVAVYAAMTGKDPKVVLEELERDRPVAEVVAPVPLFQEGRSVPPPPRSPGAQRPVDPSSQVEG